MQADTLRDPSLVFLLSSPPWHTSGNWGEARTTVAADTLTFPRVSQRLSITRRERKLLRTLHTHMQVPAIPREPSGGFLKAAEALAT